MQISLACILIFVGFYSAFSQKDTVYLKEVEIIVPRLLKYTYGGNVTIANKKDNNQNLNELISQNTATYFKNYGNGQLSTITLRGTTAAHTSVIWNDIPVNSPTLGQTDFSLWPVYLLDNVALHLGASSPAFGSGAMGGTIILSQAAASFEKGIKANINLEAGSFGNYTTAATFLVSNQKIVSQTKIYRNIIDNDFEILSENRKQNNASALRYGFDQQFNYKINKNQFLRFEGLYVYNHRNIQPLKFKTSSTDELLDKNLRFSLNYRNESGPGIWNTTVGYIINDQRYNISAQTKTSQTTITSSYDMPLGTSGSLKIGISYSNFISDVDAFISQINENRVDGYVALNYALKDWWRMSVNIRKGFYTNRSFPLVPSIGQEVDLIKNKESGLKFKSLLSKSFRIPTLNDRFWGTQGNPDLLPENGKHIEAGLVWSRNSNKNRFQISFTHYWSWVDELIIWLPSDGVFVPQNNKKVNTHGLEVSSQWSTHIFEGIISAALNYNYTKSTNKKGLNEFDQTGVNKQLPYVPYHAGNISIGYEKSGWKVNSFFEYTGDRFTNLDNSDFNKVNSYELLNLSVSKIFRLKKIEIMPYVKLNNTLNKDYENFKNYAMPGRNFLLGINFRL